MTIFLSFSSMIGSFLDEGAGLVAWTLASSTKPTRGFARYRRPPGS
jgi:hypothetical protein